MANFTDVVPVYALNNYLWKLLQSKLGMSPADYGGKTPIIPAAQQPEFNEYKKPFMVYGWSTESSPTDLYVTSVEVAAYSVYGQTAGEVNKIVTLLTKAMKRLDDSAADVNAWLHHANNPSKGSFGTLHFTQMQVVGGQGADSPNTEGGRYDGLVVIRYSYNSNIAEKEFRLS